MCCIQPYRILHWLYLARFLILLLVCMLNFLFLIVHFSSGPRRFFLVTFMYLWQCSVYHYGHSVVSAVCDCHTVFVISGQIKIDRKIERIYPTSNKSNTCTCTSRPRVENFTHRYQRSLLIHTRNIYLAVYWENERLRKSFYH